MFLSPICSFFLHKSKSTSCEHRKVLVNWKIIFQILTVLPTFSDAILQNVHKIREMEAQPLMQNTYNHFPKHKAIPFSCFFYPSNSKKKKERNKNRLKLANCCRCCLKMISCFTFFNAVFTQKSSSTSVFSLPIVFVWLLSSQHKVSHRDLIFAISEYLHLNESHIYRNEKCFLTLCLHLSTTPYAPTGSERRTHTINKEIHGDTFHYLNYGAASETSNQHVHKKQVKSVRTTRETAVNRWDGGKDTLPTHATHTHMPVPRNRWSHTSSTQSPVALCLCWGHAVLSRYPYVRGQDLWFLWF